MPPLNRKREGKTTKQTNAPHSWVLWIRFNDYAKYMYIIIEISEKWESISKSQGMGSGLPRKVSSRSRW
jgi:hypothetical protein